MSAHVGFRWRLRACTQRVELRTDALDAAGVAEQTRQRGCIEANEGRIENTRVGLPVVRRDLESHQLGKTGDRAAARKGVDEARRRLRGTRRRRTRRRGLIHELEEDIPEEGKKPPLVAEIRNELPSQIGVIAGNLIPGTLCMRAVAPQCIRCYYPCHA